MTFRHALAFIVLTVILGTSEQAPADYDTGLSAYGVGDYAAAMDKWKPLAEDGSARAQFSVAFMYDNGQGVPHDYATAAQWYMSAAEQGHPDAAWNLGMMYASGQGIRRDYVEAYKWLSIAALFGDDIIYEDRDAVAELMTEIQLDEAEAWIWNWVPR